ncbi:MAG: ATP phosphoribosyltransferase [Planctomycetota bacterium]|nr:MAG: ATP phosphoribosyltransferase [Planctomycetota bacterium]
MSSKLKMLLPDGHIQEKVLRLLDRIGLEVKLSERSYRPTCGEPEIELKMLRPQNAPKLVEFGRHDCGFAGHDLVVEAQADVVELLDLGYDPVKVVVAVPDGLAGSDDLFSKRLIVASEYERLAREYIKKKGLDAAHVRTYGATEALPPEDADMVIDNTASGQTLRLNRLTVIDEILESTTRFICNREALEDPWKKKKLEEIKMLMEATLNADKRVLLEMNVSNECFEKLVADLPCMRAPTVSPLHNEEGYAVKIAVPVKDVPKLIPRLIEAGARDILEYRLEKIVG